MARWQTGAGWKSFLVFLLSSCRVGAAAAAATMCTSNAPAPSPAHSWGLHLYHLSQSRRSFGPSHGHEPKAPRVRPRATAAELLTGRLQQGGRRRACEFGPLSMRRGELRDQAVGFPMEGGAHARKNVRDEGGSHARTSKLMEGFHYSVRLYSYTMDCAGPKTSICVIRPKKKGKTGANRLRCPRRHLGAILGYGAVPVGARGRCARWTASPSASAKPRAAPGPRRSDRAHYQFPKTRAGQTCGTLETNSLEFYFGRAAEGDVKE